MYIDRKGINKIIDKRESKIPNVTELKEIENLENPKLYTTYYKYHFKKTNFNEKKTDSSCNLNSLSFFNCTFTECYFIGSEFNNCIFLDCAFIKCHFYYVQFHSCNFFLDPLFKDYKTILASIFEELDIKLTNDDCYFNNCDFHSAEFHNSHCEYIKFTNSYFSNLLIEQSFMDHQIWYCCDFDNSSVTDSSLIGTTFVEINRLDLIIKNIIFDRETVFDIAKINTKNKDMMQDYRNRFLTLSRVSRVFKAMEYSDLAWEYYYLGKKNEKYSLKGFSRVTSSLTDALCGYGERPSHTFICIVFNILLFGFFYLLSGFAIGDKLINLAIVRVSFSNIIEMLKLYCHSVFFSVTTFSTVGYGNYVPVGAISSTLAAIQMLMGIFLTATWTGCIIRKIAR